MTDYVVKPLDPDTWDAFARLVERHNGVFGGCWCTWFHTIHAEKTSPPRATAPSRSGWSTRAAHTPRWCSTVKRQWRGASSGARRSCRTSTTARSTRPRSTLPPDYRITCIFVDKKYRRKGVTAAALGGAVDLIAQAGGGVVEGYPHDTAGKKVSVLYNGTRSLYERAGFTYVRPKGTRNCVMRRVVP